jgi:ATP-dependent protease HslVU (ClpYQ) ATPase subunit
VPAAPHTIWSACSTKISFDALEKKCLEFKVDAACVQKNLSEIMKDQDLSRYIL